MVETLSEHDHARLAEAIRAAEENTAGEIFVVVARTSDDYAALPLLWSALAALIGAAIAAFLFPRMAAGALVLQEIGAFALIAAIAHLEPVRHRLIPSALKRRRVRRNAMEQFLAHNIHTTSERTGILIFVSLFERSVEIVADEAINNLAPDGAWKEMADALALKIGEGDLAGGLEAAIGAAGDILAPHFPPAAFDRNELPDSVVEI